MQRVAQINELRPGHRRSVIIDDMSALLIRIDDDYYMVEDVCSHDGQPLTEGPVQDCAIRCPRHGARFDLRTVATLCMLATKPDIRTLDVTDRDDGIWAARRL